MQCKVSIGLLERKIPMMFQQLEAELPEGVEAVDSIVIVKKGINNYFQVPVVNQTKHEVVLRKNTKIGSVEYIKSVTPLQLKKSNRKYNFYKQNNNNISQPT